MQTLTSGAKNFLHRKVSVKKAINILAKNNINVNEYHAAVILDFLYLLAKSYDRKTDEIKQTVTLREFRIKEK